jgi:hypothetical protein
VCGYPGQAPVGSRPRPFRAAPDLDAERVPTDRTPMHGSTPVIGDAGLSSEEHPTAF